MAEFESGVKRIVCSDLGRLAVPAVSGAAGVGLGLLTGPAAVYASPALGATLAGGANVAQQNYCDGKVESGGQVLLAAAAGATGGVAVNLIRAGAIATATETSVAAAAGGKSLLESPGVQQSISAGGRAVQSVKINFNIAKEISRFANSITGLSDGELKGKVASKIYGVIERGADHMSKDWNESIHRRIMNDLIERVQSGHNSSFVEAFKEFSQTAVKFNRTEQIKALQEIAVALDGP